MRKQSLRAAVNDKCKQCIYDPKARGYWRKQVSDCTIRTCPLWNVRPQVKDITSNKGEDDE